MRSSDVLNWRKRLKTLALMLTIGAICVVLVFPVYWAIVTSLSPSGALLTYPPVLVPREVSFSSYERVLRGATILRWFANSGVVTLSTIALAVPIAALAGYSISRFKFLGVREAGSALFLARMLPATLLIIPLYYIFGQLGLINSHLALVIANTTFILPFATWMMKGFFDSVPKELEEAALIDGATMLGALVRVVIPLSLPGLAATVIYCAILSWGEFVFAKTLLTGERMWTVPIGLTSYVQEYTVRWNDVMAAGMVFAIPVIILFVVLERYLVQGLTSGGVKG